MNRRDSLKRIGRIVDELGLASKGWIVFGSAPDPLLPTSLTGRYARVDINNAGRTAQELGLGPADLTIRTKKKSCSEHPTLDTKALIWIHTIPAPMLRLLLLTKPHRSIGRVAKFTKAERDALVETVSGVRLENVGPWDKVSNGVAAACLGLHFGVPEIVLSGISLSKAGHSYNQLGRTRYQVDEDRAVLSALSKDPRLATSEPDLAADLGLRLVS